VPTSTPPGTRISAERHRRCRVATTSPDAPLKRNHTYPFDFTDSGVPTSDDNEERRRESREGAAVNLGAHTLALGVGLLPSQADTRSGDAGRARSSLRGDVVPFDVSDHTENDADAEGSCSEWPSPRSSGSPLSRGSGSGSGSGDGTVVGDADVPCDKATLDLSALGHDSRVFVRGHVAPSNGHVSVAAFAAPRPAAGGPAVCETTVDAGSAAAADETMWEQASAPASPPPLCDFVCLNDGCFCEDFDVESDGNGSDSTSTLPYILHYVIGEGSFAKVYKGVSVRTQENVAIKICRRLPRHREVPGNGELDEAAVLKQLKHPNIVTLLDSQIRPGQPEILVLEYMCETDMLNAMEEDAIEHEQCVSFLIQAAEALDFMHSSGFVHLDFKVENMLINTNTNTVKLCDFGLAGRIGQIRTGHLHGTLPYMPPELVAMGDHDECELNAGLDAWSFGIVIFIVTFQRTLWGKASADDRDYASFVDGVAQGQQDWMLAALSPQLRRIVVQLLDPVAEARPSMQRVAWVIQHNPWWSNEVPMPLVHAPDGDGLEGDGADGGGPDSPAPSRRGNTN